MESQGFLGTRAPLILDILAICLIFVLGLQMFSIVMVKTKRYGIHKKIQLGIGVVVGFFLIGFELQMRFFGWRHLAEDSPYFNTLLYPSLLLHLVFAIPTFILWIVTIFGAIKNFDVSPRPSKYSIIHKRFGKLSFVLTVGTCLTAWLFYWLAFVS